MIWFYVFKIMNDIPIHVHVCKLNEISAEQSRSLPQASDNLFLITAFILFY